MRMAPKESETNIQYMAGTTIQKQMTMEAIVFACDHHYDTQ